MEKDPKQARELLIWIQKSISDKFPFLLKGEDGNVDVHPINNFLAPYGITSSYLRKISSEHAVIMHGDKNKALCKRLCQLAVRHKIINIASDCYSIMNNRPDAVAEIIDMYNY